MPNKKGWFFHHYESLKFAMFCSAKNAIPTLQKPSVIYCLRCLRWNENCIGKTGFNLAILLHKHSLRED